MMLEVYLFMGDSPLMKTIQKETKLFKKQIHFFMYNLRRIFFNMVPFIVDTSFPALLFFFIFLLTFLECILEVV